MKKIIVSLMALIAMTATSNAQVVHTVQKPKSDVSSASYDSKLTSEDYSFQYLADGNNGRAGFHVGEGVPVSKFYGNLPKTLGDFRVVPLVTLDASEPASGPRATVALLAPRVQVLNGLSFRLGVAPKGYNSRSWEQVSGFQTYVGVNVNFKELGKAFGLKF